MEHSKYNPSGSSRWIPCPGSAGFDGETNDAADFGTWCHDEASSLLLNGATNKIDAEVEKHIVDYVTHVKAEHQRIGGDLHIEVRIVSAIPDHGGTIDALIVTEDEIHVYDLKTGYLYVPVDENTQCGCYLNLAREKFPGRKRFFATICQPKLEVCEWWEFPEPWLDDLRNKVIDATGRTDFVTGSHCEYCPVLKLCGTLKKRVRELTMIEEPTVEDWSEIVSLKKTFSNLVSEGESFLLGEIQSGKEIAGWKAANRFGRREWIDPDIAEKALAENGIDPDDMYEELKLRSPAQIEKLAKENKIEIDLGSLVTKGFPTVVLAPEKSRLKKVHYGDEFEDLADGN